MIVIRVEVYGWVDVIGEEDELYGWRLFSNTDILMVECREMYRSAEVAAIEGFEAGNRLRSAFEGVGL